MDLPRTHPIWLVLFILLSIAGGVGTWYFHDRIENPDEGLKVQLADQQRTHAGLVQSVEDNRRQIEAWRRAMGLHDANAIRAFLRDENIERYTLPQETIVLAMQKLVNDIRGEEGYRNSIQSILQDIITQYGQLANIRRDIQAATERFETRRAELAQQIANELKLNAERTAEGQQALAEMRVEIGALKNNFHTLVDQWNEKEPGLESEIAELQAVVEGFEQKLVDATGFREPADGRVLTVDYKTGHVVVDMGRENYAGVATVGRDDAGEPLRKHRDIRPDMVFDIYGQGKGDTRAPKAQIRITRVHNTTSEGVVTAVFERRGDAAEPQEASPDNNPLVPGDFVEPRVHQFGVPRFAVIGWFPDDAKYGRPEIEGLVHQWGGQVTPTVSVETQYVVLGVIDPDRVPSEQAKALAADGAQAMETARRFGVTILTVERFLQMVGRDVASAMAEGR